MYEVVKIPTVHRHFATEYWNMGRSGGVVEFTMKVRFTDRLNSDGWLNWQTERLTDYMNQEYDNYGRQSELIICGEWNDLELAFGIDECYSSHGQLISRLNDTRFTMSGCWDELTDEQIVKAVLNGKEVTYDDLT